MFFIVFLIVKQSTSAMCVLIGLFVVRMINVSCAVAQLQTEIKPVDFADSDIMASLQHHVHGPYDDPYHRHRYHRNHHRHRHHRHHNWCVKYWPMFEKRQTFTINVNVLGNKYIFVQGIISLCRIVWVNKSNYKNLNSKLQIWFELFWWSLYCA